MISEEIRCYLCDQDINAYNPLAMREMIHIPSLGHRGFNINYGYVYAHPSCKEMTLFFFAARYKKEFKKFLRDFTAEQEKKKIVKKTSKQTREWYELEKKQNERTAKK